jgi:hypothetical protein
MQNYRKLSWAIIVTVILIITASLVIFLWSQKPWRKTISSPSTRDTTKSNLDQAIAAISYDRMVNFVDHISQINAHSGWRGSATDGEKQAFNFVNQSLQSNDWLKSNGMTMELEEFNVFMGTQDHTSTLKLKINGVTSEVPADSVRGHRDDPEMARWLDSDGQLNDTTPNPITVSGELIVIPDTLALNSYSAGSLAGKIVVVNYALVDTGLMTYEKATPVAQQIINLDPEAIVLVTQFSNTVGESHGTYAGDGGGGFQRAISKKSIPLMFIQMEELASLKIRNWDEFKAISSAEVVWDVDITNPATSRNLIVHIPGNDSTRAILLSAHLDSAQSPGALDDGSGSAVLMEIITILNTLKITPDLDLYLVWYGSEELGLYGSTYFTTSHSEIINKLQANVQIDCLSRPLDGLPSAVTLAFSHVPSGELTADPLAKYLGGQADQFNIPTGMGVMPYSSDNGSLTAFDIPNVNLILESEEMSTTYAGVWYAGHLHDPYDTTALMKDVKGSFVDLTKLALSAALIPQEAENLLERTDSKKVLFLANHTQAPQMGPAGLPGFSLALIKAGYKVNVLPYGSVLTEETLSNSNTLVVLPTYDYSIADGNPEEEWLPAEAVLINEYLEGGGTVVVVNSGYRTKFYNRLYDMNEDWSGLNSLTEQWGVTFTGLGGASARQATSGNSSLINSMGFLNLDPNNSVSFSMSEGSVLVGEKEKAFLGVIQVGKGELIVISDLMALGEALEGTINPQLVENIANFK